MAKNRMSDLRDHLFETLECLKDKDAPMEIDRAKAICLVSQQLIDSAKVEVDLVRVVGGTAVSQFITIEPESRQLPARLTRSN